MDVSIDTMANLGASAIIFVLLLERIRRLEDKIMNCVINRLENMNERIARIEERIRSDRDDHLFSK